MFIILSQNDDKEIKKIFYQDPHRDVYLIKDAYGYKEFYASSEEFYKAISEWRKTTHYDITIESTWAQVSEKFTLGVVEDYWDHIYNEETIDILS